MAYGVRVCCLADGEGQSKDGRWRWEFHEYLGPTFVTKDGKMRKCPGERHPVWREFESWLKEYDAAKRKAACSEVIRDANRLKEAR
jgi:hypothetical protein